jgi:hypothetical protein
MAEYFKMRKGQIQKGFKILLSYQFWKVWFNVEDVPVMGFC